MGGMELVFDLRPQGGAVMYSGWTPVGLKHIEIEFIKRLRKVPIVKKNCQVWHGDNFLEDLAESPLSDRVIKNLIYNFHNYAHSDNDACKPIFV